MKNNFLEVFLDVLAEIPKLINDLIIRESMQKKMVRLGGIDPDTVYSGLKNLKYRKIIVSSDNCYRFTRKGLIWLKKSKFKYLSINTEKWDKKWRVIIFDVPENMRRERNIFRSKLKSFNFYMLQKSVFISPYPCAEELGFLTSYLNAGEYIDLIEANSIGFKESEIKKYYGL